ncbi:vWA domain-containing protein [Streptomyces sp. NPDC059701]|uniref:vWA domain-containing protein n=1 Tax=Streptomyces sp. NPDC059701 TaxID=3346914 RepID=UPI00367CA416
MSEYGFGFAEGLDERQPVVLLLDTSASMGRPAGSPRIDELNDALTRWFAEVRREPRLRTRVEVCLIAFDSRVRVFDPVRGTLAPAGETTADRLFVPVDRMRPPRLEASGLTRMTEAVETALDLARERYRALQAQCVQVRRPILWVLTDGAPSDAEGRRMDPAALAGTAEKVRRGEERGECVFQAVGVSGADLELLEVLAPEGTLMLDGLSLERILELMFLSSDRSTPHQTPDDMRREAARLAERQRRMQLLEERFQ